MSDATAVCTAVIPELGPLREAQPDAYDHLLELHALAEAAADPALQAVARGQIASILGSDNDATIDVDAASPTERLVADLTDQFVTCVDDVKPTEHLEPFAPFLSDADLQKFMEVLYVDDMLYRLRLTYRRLFGAGEGPLSPLSSWAPTTAGPQALERTMTAAYRHTRDLRAVDLETTELVRLACATYHDCAACQSGRLSVEGKAVADEATVAKLMMFESSDLADRHKAAVGLAMAFMIDPDGQIDDALRAKLFEHFTPEQLIELTLDLVLWTSQKIIVALNVDEAREGGLHLTTLEKMQENSVEQWLIEDEPLPRRKTP